MLRRQHASAAQFTILAHRNSQRRARNGPIAKRAVRGQAPDHSLRCATRQRFAVVGEAENGFLAVEKYRALRADIVTMDKVMPDMDGIAAVKAAVAEFPNAKIIMCTSMGQPGARRRGNSWREIVHHQALPTAKDRRSH
jgi:CheY-like chemotaxis protein